MERHNNNIEGSLVAEFLNIWSDLKRFHSPISETGDKTGAQDETLTRIDRRKNILDPRDVHENLFSEYSGTYMVKKKTSAVKEVSSSKKRHKRRSRNRPEEKKDVFKTPGCSYKSPALEIGSYEEDLISESQNIDDEKEEGDTDTELEEGSESSQHTRTLLDFLKSVHILPVLEEEEAEEGSQKQLDQETEREASSESQTHPDSSPDPFVDEIMDNNNNPVNASIIIDITSSSDSDIEELKQAWVNILPWIILFSSEDIFQVLKLLTSFI